MSATTPSRASQAPASPATTASTRLSVSSCRINRHRPAPTAARTTISRARTDDRASSRLATLAHAISSTTTDAHISMSNVDLVSPTSRS